MLKEKFKAPNGIVISVYSDGTKSYFKCRDIIKALGMNGLSYEGSKIGVAAKLNNVNVLTKKINGGASYVMEVSQVPTWLKNYIDLTLLPYSAQSYSHESKLALWRANAEALLTSFNAIPFFQNNKIVLSYKVTTQTPESLLVSTQNSLEKQSPDEAVYPVVDKLIFNKGVKEKGDIKMETKKIAPTSEILVITSKLVIEMGQTAETLAETFDVTKKDALRAVVRLKAEETKRDLTPLLDLLKDN